MWKRKKLQRELETLMEAAEAGDPWGMAHLGVHFLDQGDSEEGKNGFYVQLRGIDSPLLLVARPRCTLWVWLATT